jgi:hypothetical protein
MTRKLNELFSAPINLELEETVDGVKLYSSINLKRNFIEAFQKSSRGKDISNTVEDLVLNKKLVVPCYKSKGIFSLLKHKFFDQPEEKSIMAFFHQGNKKVYILIDNNISIIGTASNDLLVSTTSHELIHLAATLHLDKFITISNPYLKTYYKYGFMGIFDLKTNNFSVDEIIDFLYKFEGKHVDLISRLGAYAAILDDKFKLITNLDRNEFIKRITSIMTVTKIALYSFTVFSKIYKNYVYLFTPLLRAYELTFNVKNDKTTPFQELYSISEVMCVLAEIKPNDSKVKQIINILSRG